MRDPLHHLPRLRRLRQDLAGLPAGALPDAALAQALADAVRATAPPPPLPWRERLAMLAFALVVGAAGYTWKGTPAGWNPAPAPDPAAQMVQRLAQRLQDDPGAATAQDWALLGRSYAVLGQAEAGIAAYRRALAAGPLLAAVAPELQAEWQADLADLLATAQGGSLEGEPERVLAQALALDARQPKALALSATAAQRRGDVAAARALWQRVLQAAPAEHPLQRSAQQALLALPEAAASRNSPGR